MSDGMFHSLNGITVNVVAVCGFVIAPDVAIGGELIAAFVWGEPLEPDCTVLGGLNVGPGHGGDGFDDCGGVEEVFEGMVEVEGGDVGEAMAGY